jgi:hypothetical protein
MDARARRRGPEPGIGRIESRSAAVFCRTDVCYPLGRKRGSPWQCLTSISK